MSISKSQMGQTSGSSPGGMGSKSFSSPDLKVKSISRIHQPHVPISKHEDEQFSYFVPKSMHTAAKETILGSNLTRLQKANRITMPGGDGTGFRTQTGACEWWPSGRYD